MAEFPSMPLFTDAYLADTTHLSTEEHGAYLLLLIAAWRSPSCDLPDDDNQLAKYCRLTPFRFGKISATIRSFFRVIDGRLVQLRLKDERDYLKIVQMSNSIKGKHGAEVKRLKRLNRAQAGALAEVQPDASRTQAPTPTPYPQKESHLTSTTQPVQDTARQAQPPGRVAGESKIDPRYPEVRARVEALLNSPSCTGLTRLHAWLAAGCSPDLDIYPALTDHKAEWRGHSLVYFDPFVMRNLEQRTRPLIAAAATQQRPRKETAGERLERVARERNLG